MTEAITKGKSADEKTRWICERARTIGFDLCGVAPVALDVAETVESASGSHNPNDVEARNGSAAGSFPELAHLPEWLARGYAGEMNYLRDSRRSYPRLVIDGAQSLIVVALNYNSPPPYSTALAANSNPEKSNSDPPRGWISRYAWGDDYHTIIQEKLEKLLAAMRLEFPESFVARAYVDTGPIIERVAAKYAGLGWLAKNTCLINQQLGSWLFLGVIITTLALEPTLVAGEPPAPDLCGSCTRCLDACPTQAFPQPYVLDSRRCISYLTIELRGAIPEELRSSMGSAIIGCDICQDVCPWNRKASVTSLAAFAPREITRAVTPAREAGHTFDPPREISDESALYGQSDNLPLEYGHGICEPTSGSLLAPELEWLAALSQPEFREIFRHSAVKRAKWRGLVRNACLALGNSSVPRDSQVYPRIVRLLEWLASAEDSLIAEHARWALARLRVLQ